jgi:hypothetical protein
MNFAGLRVIESWDMVDTIEDWSRVRSPSRAARRREQGHRQNIRYSTTPKKVAIRHGDTLYMHPTMARELLRASIDNSASAI